MNVSFVIHGDYCCLVDCVQIGELKDLFALEKFQLETERNLSMESLRNELQLAHTSELTSLTAKHEAHLASSLSEQHEKDVEVMNESLLSQQAEHSTTLTSSLKNLETMKDKEKEQAVQNVIAEKDEEVASIRAEAAMEVEAITVLLENTKSELTSFQAK